MDTIGPPPKKVRVYQGSGEFHIKWEYDTEEFTPDDFRILFKYSNGVILEAYPKAECVDGECTFTVPDKIRPDEIAVRAREWQGEHRWRINRRSPWGRWHRD